MKYDEMIKNDLIKIKKEINNKQLKNTSIIIIIVTIVLGIIALFGGFDTPDFIGRLINCLGIIIIMTIIHIFLYAYKIFPYRYINPNKFNYEINEVIDKNYRSSKNIREDYYIINDEYINERRTLPEYSLKIKDDKHVRDTYSYVYQKVEVGKKYLIVYNGRKKRSSIINQNWIINIYDFEELDNN